MACILCMKDGQSSSLASSSTEDEESTHNISRRSALRQYATFCLSAMSSMQIQLRPAAASSFSDSPISNGVVKRHVEMGPLPPQFTGKNTVVTSRTVPDTGTPSVTQDKSNRSRGVTVHTHAWDGTEETHSSSRSSSSQTTSLHLPRGAAPELALATFTMGSIFYTFSPRDPLSRNKPGKPPIVKVVMIQPEPYGLDKGRRFYNGVDVTINDPVPKSDIREVCDAGVVSNECAESIAGFLGEVSYEQRGAVVCEEQVEKAAAVVNYLDSLSREGINGNSRVYDGCTNTAAAFYSYLNEVSSGNLPAPMSAASVASYLDSIDVNGSEVLDSYQRAVRLSAIEAKMKQLEESMDMLPIEISGKMQEWQQGHDDRLYEEIRKIRTFLIRGNEQQDDPELIRKLIGGQSSNFPLL